MRAQGATPLYPPNPAPFLTELLYEIGPTVPAGMSVAPIGWGEIAAFQQNTGVRLESWQARLIRQLAIEHVAMRHAAEKPDCGAPYGTDSDDLTIRRQAVGQKVAALFGALARRTG